jgi:hypothetical protein
MPHAIKLEEVNTSHEISRVRDSHSVPTTKILATPSFRFHGICSRKIYKVSFGEQYAPSATYKGQWQNQNHNVHHHIHDGLAEKHGEHLATVHADLYQRPPECCDVCPTGCVPPYLHRSYPSRKLLRTEKTVEWWTESVVHGRCVR